MQVEPISQSSFISRAHRRFLAQMIPEERVDFFVSATRNKLKKLFFKDFRSQRLKAIQGTLNDCDATI
jgi:hypothetical protein